MKTIILASDSPRRKEILRGLGVNFRTIGSNIKEKTDKSSSPIEVVKHFAYMKAKYVSDRLEGYYIIIGADTIVEHKKILGKPKDKQDAYNMLRLLSGKIHNVITGFAIIDCSTGQQFIDYESTKVHFKNLSNKEIQDYIATGEYMGKAGAYAIQGKASLFIKK